MYPTTSCETRVLFHYIYTGFLFWYNTTCLREAIMNLVRLESLVGNENIEKIRNLKVLVLGLGGVGGYVIE